MIIKSTLWTLAAAASILAVAACSSSSSENEDTSTDDLRALTACAGKSCGDPCQICPPNDLRCIEIAGPKFCQADGTCKLSSPVCGGDTDKPAYNPCEGKACGSSCKVCPPGARLCFESLELKFCQADGSCKGGEPICQPDEPAYNPCGDKACGDTCNVCPPNDPNCIETAELKFCQADGSCKAGVEPICN